MATGVNAEPVSQPVSPPPHACVNVTLFLFHAPLFLFHSLCLPQTFPFLPRLRVFIPPPILSYTPILSPRLSNSFFFIMTSTLLMFKDRLSSERSGSPLSGPTHQSNLNPQNLSHHLTSRPKDYTPEHHEFMNSQICIDFLNITP